MPAAPFDPQAVLDSLVAEGEQLAARRPACHKTASDLAAAVLIARMHARGFAVSIETVEGCIERMRIAVETGTYPDALLKDAEPPRGALRADAQRRDRAADLAAADESPLLTRWRRQGLPP